MGKFLSKNRLNSIKSVKVSRYFLYAVGEVLIVATGIFLAVYLNNLKEEKDNEKYISKVINEVNTEAIRYIKNAIFFMDYNARRDSLVYKILTDKVQREDYNLLGVSHLNILRTMTKLEFDNTPLENLNKRIDFLNEDEKKVYDRLKFLKSNQDGYKVISENAKEILNDYKRFQKENHEWFYQIEYDSIATQKEFEYRLESFEYKNYLRDYSNYEIYHKSNSYSFLQIVALITHFRAIEVQKNEKLKTTDIDSLLTTLTLKKLQKSKCTTDDQSDGEMHSFFEENSLYNFVLNASKDTIQIKNGYDQVVAKVPPKGFSTVQVYNGTNLKVFVAEACVAQYKTQINSYLFHE